MTWDTACLIASAAAWELDSARHVQRLDPQRYIVAQAEAVAAFNALVAATHAELDRIESRIEGR